MLVLSRRAGDEILIGKDIVITYLGDKHGAARIGIEAPEDIPILRRELMERQLKKALEAK